MALFKSPHLIYKIIETGKLAVGSKIVCGSARHDNLMVAFKHYQADMAGQFRHLGRLFDKPYLESCASRDSDTIKSFTGINVPVLGDNDVALCGVSNLPVTWRGKKSFIKTHDQQTYPGFSVPADIWNVSYLDPRNKVKHYTVMGWVDSTIKSDGAQQAPWQNVDCTFLMPHRAMTSVDEMYDLVKSITCHSKNSDYEDLCCPNVNVVSQSDLNWLKGLGFQEGSGPISKVVFAHQETRFKMDHNGVLARSAAVAVIKETCMGVAVHLTQPMIIDRPFIMIIRTPGLSDPLLVSYLPESCWGNVAQQNLGGHISPVINNHMVA